MEIDNIRQQEPNVRNWTDFKNPLHDKFQETSPWHQRAQTEISTLERNLRALSLKADRSDSEEHLVEKFRESWNSRKILST